jgi:hypothetical protein
MKRLFCAAAMLLLIGGQGFAGSSLSSSELKRLAPGRYQVTLYNAISMTVTMKPNGTVVGTSSTDHDTGTWSLSGNRLCIAWHTWLGGQARCSGLVSDGNKYHGSGFTFTRI